VDAEGSDEDDDDDGVGDVNDVFGVTSVVNITEKHNLECVQQLRNLLLELCSEHATDQANTLIRSLLSDGSQSIGLLISERIVNIPAQISVPLLESLRYFQLQYKFYTSPFSICECSLNCGSQGIVGKMHDDRYST
jgi:protein BCP1